MFRIHVIPNPYVPTHEKYSSDAFSQIAIRFCRMMKRNGHYVIFYGIESFEDQIEASEYVPVIKLEEYMQFENVTKDFTHPSYMLTQSIFPEIRNYLENKFYEGLKDKLNQNYKPNDIVGYVLPIQISEQFPNMINVTLSDGSGSYCPNKYVTFISLDHFNHVMNLNEYNKKYKNLLMWNEFGWPPVIYPWFYPEDFIFNENSNKNRYNRNYFLFLARCQKLKGVHKILEFANKRKNYEFVIAGGFQSFNQITRIMYTGEKDESANDIVLDFSKSSNIDVIGPVNKEQRKELLANCIALLQPTTYREPCGFNAIEAMFSGKPAVCSDFGGFINTVKDGETGFLCSIDKTNEWIKILDILATNNNTLNPDKIRQYALTTFSEKIALDKYTKFFNEIIKYESTLNKKVESLTC